MPDATAAGGGSDAQAHPERTIEQRLADLELAVFGNPRQRIVGLINLMPELAEQVRAMRDDVAKLKDNKQFVISLVVQGATLLSAVAALIVALRGGA